MFVLFFDEHSLSLAECFGLLSTDLGDAKPTTDLILAKLTKAGLTFSKIRRQVYDGAFVMTGSCRGVQRLLKERENRAIPYSHCLNHLLHFALLHALLTQQAINNVLHICCSLYNFFATPQLYFTIIVKS